MMKSLKLKYLLILFALAFQSAVFAQDVQVKAIPDTTNIRIGEQTSVMLEAIVPITAKVQFPLATDSLMWAVEILGHSPIDSTVKNGVKTYQQSLTVSSFDSGFHAIPPQPFVILNNDGTVDSVFSDAFLLGVHTVAIDTAQAIKDIKEPIQAPVTFAEMLPYISIGLAVILLGLLGYFYWKKQQSKPKVEKKEPVKPREPAHIIAIRELNQLKSDEVWQKGQYKEYHSRLTEILRRYIEYRYEIPALEQTTDEIIRSFDYTGSLDKETIEKLAQTFRFADLVKFAKMHPLPEENERSLKQAFNFIENTKLEAKPEEKDTTQTTAS
ncbi:hypothetical protein [Chondrinema litorale]|uniref:hypothetical protein n=1 Tax=Chondrinema litorale TaxID=2994555 RepID=UPI00254330DD|nr:hypothetical protein [Chondrinema litorale]UZR92823.1 hypothetical protein OQ292_13260 [Chondrinema litorale]